MAQKRARSDNLATALWNLGIVVKDSRNGHVSLKGFSPKDLSNAMFSISGSLAIDETRISHLINGHQTINHDQLELICDILGLSDLEWRILASALSADRNDSFLPIISLEFYERGLESVRNLRYSRKFEKAYRLACALSDFIETEAQTQISTLPKESSLSRARTRRWSIRIQGRALLLQSILLREQYVETADIRKLLASMEQVKQLEDLAIENRADAQLYADLWALRTFTDGEGSYSLAGLDSTNLSVLGLEVSNQYFRSVSAHITSFELLQMHDTKLLENVCLQGESLRQIIVGSGRLGDQATLEIWTRRAKDFMEKSFVNEDIQCGILTALARGHIYLKSPEAVIIAWLNDAENAVKRVHLNGQPAKQSQVDMGWLEFMSKAGKSERGALQKKATEALGYAEGAGLELTVRNIKRILADAHSSPSTDP